MRTRAIGGQMGRIARPKGHVWRTGGSLAALVVLAAAALMPSGAVTAADIEFPANYFGRNDLPLPQSLSHLEKVLDERDNFEAISEFAASNRYRKISAPVGRLEMLIEANGKRFMSTCTAWVIDADMIMTNYHCIPGHNGTVVKALLRMDYLVSGGDGAVAYEVTPQPIEADPEYDYAIVPVSGDPTQKFGKVTFRVRTPNLREELFLVHHPAGKPKKLTRRRCRTISDARGAIEFRHSCDTMGGSSGSPVFSDNDMALVGLHFAGSQEANFAKRLEAIVQQSPTLTALVGATTAVKPAPPVAPTTVKATPAPAPVAKPADPPVAKADPKPVAKPVKKAPVKKAPVKQNPGGWQAIN